MEMIIAKHGKEFVVTSKKIITLMYKMPMKFSACLLTIGRRKKLFPIIVNIASVKKKIFPLSNILSSPTKEGENKRKS